MHDLAEGVIPLEMHLVLKRLIDNGAITLEVVNSRIHSFSYGFVDRKNRPSPIKLGSITKPGGAS